MKTKIIVVDDDAELLEWVKTGLSLEDRYEVITATSMDDGWEKIQSERPKLAIIDLKLPDGDGFELCRLIKHNLLTAEISVLLITGVYKEVDYKEKGYAIGADGFLIKPFSYEQLKVKVMKQLQQRDQV